MTEATICSVGLEAVTGQQSGWQFVGSRRRSGADLIGSM
jgi:hypothetical protein